MSLRRTQVFRRFVLPFMTIVFLASCNKESVQDLDSKGLILPPLPDANRQVQIESITLSEDQAAELNIQTVTVELVQSGYTITLPGEVYPAPEHFAQVSAPISGRVAEIYAHEGEEVIGGQVLLTLESLEFAILASDYLQAKAEEVYQQRQVDRLQTLVERKITSSSRLERAEADLSRAEVSVNATYSRLKAIGITDQQLEAWSTASRERPLLPINAPISGTIDQHLVDLGQSVTAYEQMMSVINTEKVLIRGFVSPEDAPMIEIGDSISAGMKGLPDRALSGTVTTINPSVDAQNRSVTINIIVPTVDNWPIPGQNVRLEIQSSQSKPFMLLPLSAIQYEGKQATVFVQTGSLTFVKRAIEIERVTESEIIVSAGLTLGEKVVVSQVFSLKAIGRYEQ